ncbi:TPA-induced transmembrane protein homolog [Cololabis saira]|uniref:TPA-induced transmembrane protein homolog n=1 Tax=Cololabis saira TaxID=129043 RepID=UPI002AD425B7|nr:TPA-induced transmembrane protein homolog [Cololabis saira]XP_061575746.1 TPA-induced transmembrane protein homolog [Cololabis saira]
MDLELDVIGVRDGAAHSFDQSDRDEEAGGKVKQLIHMDASQTQGGDFVALQVTASNADELDYIDATARRNSPVLQAAAACADGVDHMDPYVAESQGLMQMANGNGERMAMGTEGQQNGGNGYHSQENIRPIYGIAELNKKVYRGVRLWMIILLILVIIAVVIVGTLAVCSAIHVDEDEQFDRSLFKIPHYFNGSFDIPSNPSYNESQVSADLQQKLADLYRSSHALGRYFSEAEIYALRNNSVAYKLTFVLPDEEKEELRNLTVSREMVYNVFRQFLYDQDPVEPGGMHIDKASLKMDVHKQTEGKA